MRATTGPVSLAEEGMTFVQVGGMAVGQSPTEERKGKGAPFWALVGAGVGGALGLVATASDPDCDRPESLCPLGVGVGAAFAGLVGLLVGQGR